MFLCKTCWVLCLTNLRFVLSQQQILSYILFTLYRGKVAFRKSWEKCNLYKGIWRVCKVLWIVNTHHVSYYTYFVLPGEQGQGTLDRVLSMYLSSDHLIPGCLLTSSVVSLPLTGESEVWLLLQVSVSLPFCCKLLRLTSLGAFPSQITLLELPFLLHQVLAEFIDSPLRSHPSAKIDICCL